MREWLGCAAALALVVTAGCGRSSRHEGVSSAGSPGKGGNGDGGSGVGGASGKGGFGGIANAGRGGDVPTAGAAGGTGGIADCSVDPTEIDGLSFLVHFTDTDGFRCCEGVPGPTTFHFEQAAADLEVVIGSEGQAF